MNFSEAERANPVDIRKYQFALLRETLAYVYENSKFYKNQFSKIPGGLESIQSLEDLTKIPTVNKADLQEAGRDFWCVGQDQILDYTATSGTEGKQLTIPLTGKDLQRLAVNEAGSFRVAGATEKDIFQLTTTTDRRFMAGLAYTLGAREMGAGMVRVGPGVPQMQWDTIFETGATVLIAVPSFLIRMIDFAEANGIDFQNSGIRKVICIGEPIRKPDFSLNALGTRIREKWPIELNSSYASTEMATAFTECEAARGGHVPPNLIFTEILASDGNPLPEGQPGELTITTFGVEAMPLVRFRTGDICAMHTEVCACGRTTPRLGPIIGRRHQMIKYKGTTCYPQALCEVMDEMSEIDLYQIQISHDAFSNDLVAVKYHARQPISRRAMAERFKSRLRFTPDFVETDKDEIQALLFPSNMRKPLKMDDRRKSATY